METTKNPIKQEINNMICFRCNIKEVLPKAQYLQHYAMSWHKLTISLQGVVLCSQCKDEIFDKITKSLRNDKYEEIQKMRRSTKWK